MKSVLAIGLLSVLAASSAQAVTWVQWNSGPGANNHWYALSDQASSWTGSRSAALALGGDLASVTSLNEHAFILSNIGTQQLWIGYNDAAVEGTWVWSDGTPSAFTLWAPGEPNNAGNEDYAVMNWGAGGSWNDLPDHNQAFAVFERVDNLAVPEGGATLILTSLAILGLSAFGRRK